MSVRVDVLCVGLGPAGARAAWAAASRGLRVLGIDRRSLYRRLEAGTGAGETTEEIDEDAEP